MALDVEAIWVDLFARLSANVEGVRTFSRRRIQEPSPEQCPVLMLLDDSGDEVASDNEGLPPLWSLGGEIVIVTRNHPLTDTLAVTALNAIIKSVRTALERTPTDTAGTGPFYGGGHVQHYTNLGGKLRLLRIARVEKGSLGENSGQAVAKLTLDMEALG
jgi:hypothetical protein